MGQPYGWPITPLEGRKPPINGVAEQLNYSELQFPRVGHGVLDLYPPRTRFQIVDIFLPHDKV